MPLVGHLALVLPFTRNYPSSFVYRTRLINGLGKFFDSLLTPVVVGNFTERSAIALGDMPLLRWGPWGVAFRVQQIV
jgi:hypothetical protein